VLALERRAAYGLTVLEHYETMSEHFQTLLGYETYAGREAGRPGGWPRSSPS